MRDDEPTSEAYVDESADHALRFLDSEMGD